MSTKKCNAEHYVFAISRLVFPIFDIEVEHWPEDQIFEDFGDSIVIDWVVPPLSMAALYRQLVQLSNSSDDYSYYAFERSVRISAFTSELDRYAILDACRYFYLKGVFDQTFWHHLCRRGESPIEARPLICGDADF